MNAIKNEKIVLCRPRGGLNDMLVQIEKCRAYCEKHNRKLFIDGKRGGFLDDFANYFIPTRNISFETIDFSNPPFDVFPSVLRDDIYDYDLRRNMELRLFETDDGTPITFDFKKDYKEQILVHEQSGGGDTGILAIARFQLRPEIKIQIREKVEQLRSLGKNGKYDAIHIRNTDYKTDYKSYFDKIKNKIDKTTVLCTDDFACQQYAKNIFGKKLQITTDIPDLSKAVQTDYNFTSRTLHRNANLNRYKTNTDALVDLFVMAEADKLYFTRVSAGCLSGFTMLAQHLHENKKIVKNMLYETDDFRLPSVWFAFRFRFMCLLRGCLEKIFGKLRG